MSAYISDAPATDPAAVTATAADHPEPARTKRARRYRGHLVMDHDATATFTTDAAGTEIATVPLGGRHGVLELMTLDAADWRDLSQRYGARWGVSPGGSPASFVITSGRSKATGGARGRVTLARIIARAQRGGIVIYHDGDYRNLVRANLCALTPTQAAAWRGQRAEEARLRRMRAAA